MMKPSPNPIRGPGRRPLASLIKVPEFCALDDGHMAKQAGQRLDHFYTGE
ncbi:hypothetical protein MBLL_04288 [Methylobacterium bullatum]|uniref:Uncharacterized protein n=1 Tax=Methylobacterium bullatum TaxID=570505 RepID=A0A679KJ21_9HYPH|nr:hypothetical protein MBLL_04288 [Methylobacterium bullatum]